MPPPEMPPHFEVEEFVIAAHGSVARVRELHEANPALLLATWEKFNETALQAASHMGRRDVAEYLLSAGAPLDICAAAMLGMVEQVASQLADDPTLSRAKGAHGITVLYHAALSGRPEVAELLISHGGGEGIDDALHAAARFGHAEMVSWLLANGARNVNVLNFDKKTPLRVAVENNFTETADVLRKAGGVE